MESDDIPPSLMSRHTSILLRTGARVQPEQAQFTLSTRASNGDGSFDSCNEAGFSINTPLDKLSSFLGRLNLGRRRESIGGLRRSILQRRATNSGSSSDVNDLGKTMLEQAQEIMVKAKLDTLSQGVDLEKLVNGQNKGDDEGGQQDSDLTLSELTRALRVVLNRMLVESEDARHTLLELFSVFDCHDVDGNISMSEFSECMNILFSTQFNAQTITTIFTSIDTNMSGQISFQEFINFFSVTDRIKSFEAEMPDTVTCVKFSRNGTWLAYGGNFGVGVIESRTGRIIFKRKILHVQSIALSSDGRWLYVSHWNSSIAILCFELEIPENFLKTKKMPESPTLPKTFAEEIKENTKTETTAEHDLRIPETKMSPTKEKELQPQSTPSVQGKRPKLPSISKALLAAKIKIQSSRWKNKSEKQSVKQRLERKLLKKKWQEQSPFLEFEIPWKVWCIALSLDDKFLAAGGGNGVAHLYDASTGELLMNMYYPSRVNCIAVARVPLLAAVFHEPICGISEKVFGDDDMLSTHLWVSRKLAQSEICVNLTGKHLPRVYAASLSRSRISCDEVLRSQSSCYSVLVSGIIKLPFSSELGMMTVRLHRASADLLNAQPSEDLSIRSNSDFGNAPSIFSYTFDPRLGNTHCSSLSGADDKEDEYKTLGVGTHVVLAIRCDLQVHSHRHIVAIGGESNSVYMNTFFTLEPREEHHREAIQSDSPFAKSRDLVHELSRKLRSADSFIAKNMKAICSEFNSTSKAGFSSKFGAYITGLHTFEMEMKSAVNSLCFNGDASLLAVGAGLDDVVILLTSPTKEEELITFVFKEQVNCVCLSRDGTRLAVCGHQGKVAVYDTTTGCCAYSKNFNKIMKEISFGGVYNNPASCIVFGGFDKIVHCENFDMGIGLRSFPGSELVRSISISDSGHRLAIGTFGGTVRVVDYHTGITQRSWHTPNGACTFVALSKDGHVVISGNYKGFATVRHVDHNLILHEHCFEKITSAPNFVWAVAISDDMTRVAAGSWTGEVRVWDTATWKLACNPINRPDRANSIALSADGRRILVGCRDGSAVLYGLPSPPKIDSFDVGDRVLHAFEGRGIITEIDDMDLSFPQIHVKFDSGTIHEYDEISVTSGELVLERQSLLKNKSDPVDNDGFYDSESGALPSAATLFTTTFPDRIYAVAMTDKYFALAGMHPNVELFKLSAPLNGKAAKDLDEYKKKLRFRLVQRFRGTHSINSVAFSPDGKNLATGGDDKMIKVWSIDEESTFDMRVLLRRREEVQCVCFSNSLLAFGLKYKVVTYGEESFDMERAKQSTLDWSLASSAATNSWQGIPEFEMVADSLHSRVALTFMKQRQPYCASIRSPHTGESVLQRCVLVRNNAVLQTLLEGNEQIGFVRDKTGFTPLKVALKLEKRRCVETLLAAVTEGRVSTSSLSTVTECFPDLYTCFPELLLKFIAEMPLVAARGISIDSQDVTVPKPKSGWGHYVRGTQKRTEPRTLWTDIFVAARETQGLREGEMREEMIAMQVPFENFVGTYDNVDQSPFHLITAAAHKLNNYAVFESLIMKSAIQFKWEMYARANFEQQFFLFGALLTLVIVFSISASQSLNAKNCGLFDFYFHISGSCKSGSADDNALIYARISCICFPLVFGCTSYFLSNELAQLKESISSAHGDMLLGVRHYFSSIWNYLDVFGFGLQVVAQTLWVCHQEGIPLQSPTRLCLALACIFLGCKTMYYARGYTRWGPMVRMIIEIMSDMGPFIFIVVWFLSTFSLALLILNEDTLPYILIWNSEKVCDFDDKIGVGDVDDGEYCKCKKGECSQFGLFWEYLQFMVTSALYGDPTSFFMLGVHPTRSNQLIFNLSLLLVQIILLNLVIAVMGATYERVAAQTVRQGYYEKAAIIVEVEETWAPRKGNFFLRFKHALFIAASLVQNIYLNMINCFYCHPSRTFNSTIQKKTVRSGNTWSLAALAEIERNMELEHRIVVSHLFPRWLQVLMPRDREAHNEWGGDKWHKMRDLLTEENNKDQDNGINMNDTEKAEQHNDITKEDMDELKKMVSTMIKKHETDLSEIHGLLKILIQHKGSVTKMESEAGADVREAH